MSLLPIPACETQQELQKHWSDFLWMVANEQKFIVNETGCLIPCTYKEYKESFQMKTSAWFLQVVKDKRLIHNALKLII